MARANENDEVNPAMNLRLWLKRNFFRRGLRWLSESAQQRLFSSLRLPSLFPRLPWRKRRSSKTAATTLLKNERRLDAVCDQDVRLDVEYVDFIAPLNALPDKVTVEQLRVAIEQLPNYAPQGPLFFPGKAYLAAGRAHKHIDVEFVHRCRIRSAGSEFKSHPTLSRMAPANEPETLLIYDRPNKRLS